MESAGSVVTIGRATLFTILGFVLVAGGCAIVPSAYRVDLWKTDWVVTELDHTSLSGDITLSFNENDVAEEAHLRTPCGTTQMAYGLDTDGDEFGISDVKPVQQADCSAEQRQTEAALLAALEGVEEWSVQDDDHIRLSGTNDIYLVRE